MKTAEERAREVIEAAFDTPHNYELRQKNVAAIIRADRQALLDRVEEVFEARLKERFTLHPRVQSSFLALGFETTAAVQEEAL